MSADESQAEQRSEVTRLLGEWSRGNQQAMEELLPLLYGELRRLAGHYFERERSGHTLQPTAVVHEAFLRLAGQQSVEWKSRAHFLAMAATMMRRVLLDYAKAKRSDRRGGGLARVELHDALARSEGSVVEILEVDEALGRLAALDEVQAKVVELRFFGGLSVDESAEALGISPATVKRYWNSARAWLHREITGGGSSDPG